jgi:hypothetical protein
MLKGKSRVLLPTGAAVRKKARLEEARACMGGFGPLVGIGKGLCSGGMPLGSRCSV